MRRVLLLMGILLIITLPACAMPVSGGDLPGEMIAACPRPTAHAQSLVCAEQGYCLLYPRGYQWQWPNHRETVFFVGSPTNHEQPRVSITVQAAVGRTAERAADAILAEHSGAEIGRTLTLVGGERAVVLDGVPGQDLSTCVLVVANCRLYVLTFTPIEEGMDDYGPLQVLYDTVIGSLHFLPR